MPPAVPAIAAIGGAVAAAAPVLGAVAAVASTGLSIYQAVRRPSVSTIAGAAIRTLQLPGQLADLSVKLGFTDKVPESIAPAIEVTQALSEVLGRDLTNMVAEFARTLKPLADLDPRLRDMIVPLIGIGGKSLPDLASVLALTVGKPRRRFRDLPLMEFTGLDEDVQPLGEVVDEVWRSEAALTRQVMENQAAAARQDEAARQERAAQIFEQLTDISAESNQQAAERLRLAQEQGQGLMEYLTQELERVITRGLLPRAELLIERVNPVIVPLARLLVSLIVDLAGIAHEPAAEALRAPLVNFFERYRAGIRLTEEVRPEDAPLIAERAFSEAMRFGFTAHMFALVVEMVHPLKHLGLPQLAAGLVDAAAFGPIMGHTVGRSISVGVGRATEWQARRDFRTVWGSVRDFEAMYLERRISRETFAERLRWEGWPEWQIEAYLALGEEEQRAVPWREPRMFDLAVTFEDQDVPESWVLEMIRQSGYADADAEHLLTGLKVRSLRSYRSGLIAEVQGAFEDGLLTEEDFRRFLAPLTLREESMGLLLDRARLALARNQAKKLATAQRTLVEQDVVDLDQYRVSLRALGYVDTQVEVEAALVDARRRGRLLKEEMREGQAELRDIQEETVRLYEERIRRGLATVEEFERLLLELGFEPQLARASAELARVRQAPVLRLPTALTPEAQRQRVGELLQEEVLARVQREALDPGLAGLQLMALGIPTEEVEALVRLAIARIPRKPAVEEPKPEPAEVREVRRIRTQEALERFQAGEIDEGDLREALLSFGHTEEVAEATVAREATERRIRERRETAEALGRVAREAAAAAERAQAEATRQRSAAFAEIQRLQRDIILQATRTGEVDPEAARVSLRMIGLSPEEADLLLTRETFRRARTTRAGGT